MSARALTRCRILTTHVQIGRILDVTQDTSTILKRKRCGEILFE